MPGPTPAMERRTPLGGERRPQSEVLKDAPDENCRALKDRMLKRPAVQRVIADDGVKL